MTPRERLIAPAGFIAAGVLFVIAAVVPLAKGRPLNATFIPLGVVFFILGAAMWRKVKSDGSSSG
jgi:hypothetical protein